MINPNIKRWMTYEGEERCQECWSKFMNKFSPDKRALIKFDARLSTKIVAHRPGYLVCEDCGKIENTEIKKEVK